MKILMICDFFHESQLYQENLLAKYYLKQGHNVTVIASNYTSVIDYYKGKKIKVAKPNSYLVNNLKIIRLNYKINFFNKIRLLKGLKQRIVEERPDVIYVHGFPLNLYSCIKHKEVRTNIVFDSHADSSNTGNKWLSLNILHGFFYKLILKKLLYRIDNFFYITPLGGKFMNEVYKIPYESMSLLPLGADIDYIERLKKKYSKNDLREKLNIKPSDFVIFTGGKLTTTKKTELVIEAFNSLKDDKIHLIVVGESMTEKYNKKILELGKGSPNIHFTGWLKPEEIYKFLYLSDVGVYPSAASVMWQQSIGVGLPLIVGDDNGQDAEYLNRNNNMFILKGNNVTAKKISVLLIKLIEDKDLLNCMKKGAKKTANDFLSYDKISKMSINFLNK